MVSNKHKSWFNRHKYSIGVALLGGIATIATGGLAAVSIGLNTSAIYSAISYSTAGATSLTHYLSEQKRKNDFKNAVNNPETVKKDDTFYVKHEANKFKNFLKGDLESSFDLDSGKYFVNNENGKWVFRNANKNEKKIKENVDLYSLFNFHPSPETEKHLKKYSNNTRKTKKRNKQIIVDTELQSILDNYNNLQAKSNPNTNITQKNNKTPKVNTSNTTKLVQNKNLEMYDENYFNELRNNHVANLARITKKDKSSLDDYFKNSIDVDIDFNNLKDEELRAYELFKETIYLKKEVSL